MEYQEAPTPSFLFDLDGTLIDSVYQHVISWLREIGQSLTTDPAEMLTRLDEVGVRSE